MFTSERMDDLEKLISRLGSFWKGKRKKAVDELVWYGVRNPKNVIPALLGAMQADKEKVKTHAWETYQRIAQQVEVTGILLSQLYSNNHNVAVNLLDRRGAETSNYLNLISHTSRKLEELEELEMNIEEFKKRREEARKIYFSQKFDAGISKTKKLFEELKILLDKTKRTCLAP